jgi:hypothetical protein
MFVENVYSGLPVEGYLSQEEKTYYLSELDKFRNIKDVYWDFDDGVLPIVDAINSNTKIVTLLSKRPNVNLLKTEEEYESYLHIAASADVVSKIDIFLADIGKLFSEIPDEIGELCRYSISFDEPSERTWSITKKYANLDVISKVEKYTAINRCVIGFCSYEEKYHELFWNELLKLKDI